MFTASNAVQRILAQSQRPANRPGPDVISLASGDPDFPTPDYICQALTHAINSGYTHYGDNRGDPELREAIADRVTQRAGHQYSPQQILVTHGGSGALAASILATVNPGDRVLLPEPTFSLYADLVQLAGGVPVFVPCQSDFHLDFEALTAASADARMIVLCHPGNPTGVVYRRDELQELASLAEQRKLLVMSDEAYDNIVFSGTEFISCLEIPELRDRLIYCQTFSKTYAMTGWRIGYLVAPQPIADAAAVIQRTLLSTINGAVQRAALAALTTPSDWPERMRREYEARRELVLEMLAGVDEVSIEPPEGTFYAFIRYVGDIPASTVVAEALRQGVAIRAGTEYGPSGANHVRVAFSTDRERLRNGLMRLRTVFVDLHKS